MELIAKKTFRTRNSRIVKKGERFSCDALLGRVYLTVGHAEHPPREIAAPEPKVPEPAPQVYNTRVMTADVPQQQPRRRGRPRKKTETEN